MGIIDYHHASKSWREWRILVAANAGTLPRVLIVGESVSTSNPPSFIWAKQRNPGSAFVQTDFSDCYVSSEEEVTACVKLNKANRITLIRTMTMVGMVILTEDLDTRTTFEGQAYVA